MYWSLINNVGLFHLNYKVLKYVSASIITKFATYLNKKCLVLFSCVFCQINLRVYGKPSRYLSFLTTLGLVDDILRYIYSQHYLRTAWTAYFPHNLYSTCTAHTPSLLFLLQPYWMDSLHYIYLRTPFYTVSQLFVLHERPSWVSYLPYTAYFPHNLYSTCKTRSSLLFALQPYWMDYLHYIYR